MLKISEAILRQHFESWKAHKITANELALQVTAFFDGEPVAEYETARREKAIRDFHVQRGCCDGTFEVPCTWKQQQTEAKERKVKSQPRDEYEGTD